MNIRNILKDLFGYNKIALLNFIILVFVSFFGTSLPFSERTIDPYEAESSNPVNQIVFIFLFISNFYLVLENYKSIMNLLFNEKFLSLFIFFCVLSFLWSNYPLISFKRSFQLFVTYITIINSVIIIPYKKILSSLLFISLLYTILTYLSCFLIPDAIDPTFGTWRGLELSKNGLGYLSLMLTIIGFTILINHFDPKLILKSKILIFSGIGLIIMAFSTTNIIAILILVFIVLLKKFSKLFASIGIKKFAFYSLVIFVVLIGFIVSIYSKEILAQIPGLFGKDTSLTGRDLIWLYIWSEIKKQFLLGYGYGTYWIMGTHIIDLFTSFVGWQVNEAHNGFLEIMLQLGITGFAIFLLIITKFTIKIIKYDDLPSLLLLIGIFIVNFSESFLFNPRDVATFLFMLYYLFIIKKDIENKAISDDLT